MDVIKKKFLSVQMCSNMASQSTRSIHNPQFSDVWYKRDIYWPPKWSSKQPLWLMLGRCWLLSSLKTIAYAGLSVNEWLEHQLNPGFIDKYDTKMELIQILQVSEWNTHHADRTGHTTLPWPVKVSLSQSGFSRDAMMLIKKLQHSTTDCPVTPVVTGSILPPAAVDEKCYFRIYVWSNFSWNSFLCIVLKHPHISKIITIISRSRLSWSSK